MSTELPSPTPIRTSGAELRSIREQLGLLQSEVAVLAGWGGKARVAQIEGQDAVPVPIVVRYVAALAAAPTLPKVRPLR